MMNSLVKSFICRPKTRSWVSHTLIAMPRASRDPDMRILLETTKAELEERYVKVEALLDRRYFTQ